MLSRIDLGASTSTDLSLKVSNLSDGNISGTETDDMARAKRGRKKLELVHLGSGQKELENFMDNWISCSCICINFKMTQQVNEPIGIKVRRSLRGSNIRRSRNRSINREENNNEPDFEQDVLSQERSPEGLELSIDIDSKKHILSRLYVSFEDSSKVYIVSNTDSFQVLKDRLSALLRNNLSSRNRHDRSEMTKLYVQNIVTTYKVLHAAFKIDPSTLNDFFEWHAFDVAWWMINDCPNRGFNNCNSSLSLVAKTNWASQYHYLLHPDAKRSKANANPDDYIKLKDIVKAGKTVILKPLITEIVRELEARNQSGAYFDAEIPSRTTMAQMMIHGIGLNMRNLKDEISLYEDLSNQLTDIAQKHYAKSTISLTNIRHVAKVLYEDLDLRKHLLDFSTNSNISKDPTNSEILKILSVYHPFPRLVQDFRRVGKALEALQSVCTHARFNSDLGMMRVFGSCDFWQLTGRVAMFDPDLFLINRNFTVLLPAHGNRPEESVECAPRKCFVPSKGWMFIAADYSQLELRLLAHFSNDAQLLGILNRDPETGESTDVFRRVASRVYNKPIEDITDENRQHAKQVCYGIIYGMGNRSLANQLGVDVEQAEDFRRDFFEAFPRIPVYTDELIKSCEEIGYVESLLGRRRLIEGINSDNQTVRARAERVAINTRIQSSASDIIKLAMQRMNRKILAKFDKNARLVLEMHDELIYEVGPSVVDEFTHLLRETMEELTELERLNVRLLVNLKRGTNWSNLETITLD